MSISGEAVQQHVRILDIGMQMSIYDDDDDDDDDDGVDGVDVLVGDDAAIHMM